TEPDEWLGRQNTSSPCIPSRSARIPAGQISSAPPPCRPLAVSLASRPRVREHGTVALRTVRHPVRKARTCGRYFAQTPAGSRGAAAHALACPCFHWYEESAQCRLTPVQSPLPFRARHAAERCREHPFPSKIPGCCERPQPAVPRPPLSQDKSIHVRPYLPEKN